MKISWTKTIPQNQKRVLPHHDIHFQNTFHFYTLIQQAQE